MNLHSSCPLNDSALLAATFDSSTALRRSGPPQAANSLRLPRLYRTLIHAAVKDLFTPHHRRKDLWTPLPQSYVDIAKQGDSTNSHRSGGPPKATTGAPGSGVACLIQNDGWARYLSLNGSKVPPLKGRSLPRRHAVSQQSRRTLRTVNDKAGVANERWGFGRRRR